MKLKILLFFVTCINFFNAQNNGLPSSDYYYIYDGGGGVHLGIDLTKSEQIDSVYAIEIFDEDRKKIYSDTLTFVNNKITLRAVDGSILYNVRFDRNDPSALTVYNLDTKEKYLARYASTTEKEENELKEREQHLAEVRVSMKKCVRLYSYKSYFIGIKKITDQDLILTFLSERGALENLTCKKSENKNGLALYVLAKDELDAFGSEFHINDEYLTWSATGEAQFKRVEVETLDK
jgi:hypothetical protein